MRCYRCAWLLGLVALLTMVRPAAAGSGDCELHVTLLPVGPEVKTLPGRLIFSAPALGPGDEERVVDVAVRGMAPLPPVMLSSGTTWQLRVEIPGAWAPFQALNLGTDERRREHVVPLWPVGRIEGRLRAVSGQPLPADLGVRFRSGRHIRPGQREAAGRVTCPVAKDGAWSCQLPVATLDLVLVAEGFVPEYRRAVEVSADRAQVLGVVQLRRGASVAGWVKTEEGRLDPKRCRAFILPLSTDFAGSTGQRQVQDALAETTVGEDGFFQLAGLKPGAYLLEVRQPGFAPGRVLPLELWTDSETVLKDAVVLRPPITLELRLAPALDWLGHAWQVQVLRASEHSAGYEPRPVFQGAASAAGEVRIREQAPGRFKVQVADSEGNIFLSDDHVVIDNAGDATRWFDLDIVAVHGRVTLGKEPLPATLWFGGRHGSVRLQLEADSDGEFAGALPRSGRWLVEVLATEPAIESHVQLRVEVESGEAEVTIELPDTELFGRVLDDQGHPVAEAGVLVETAAGTLQLASDAEGKFAARALPVGPVALQARRGAAGGPQVSDRVVGTLLEEQVLGPLELRLRRGKELRGSVRGAQGPVIGASVDLLPLAPQVGFGGSARTGLEGRFTVQIPAPVTQALVVVGAPGSFLKAFSVGLRDGEPLELEVPASGGDLRLELPASTEELWEQGWMMSLYQDDLPILLGLYPWVVSHGGQAWGHSLRLPRLAVGDYRACLLPEPGSVDAAASSPEVSDGPRVEGRCVAGFLSPGGTLDLRLELPASSR